MSVFAPHRDYLRFYKPSESEEVVYRHCRVVFGVTSSAFLLSAVLHDLLDNCPSESQSISQKLKYSLYVDNCVTGVESVEEQIEFVTEAIKIMKRGCFNLRGWESNVSGPNVTKSSGEVNVLGILWNLDKDTLRCNILPNNRSTLSKRCLLGVVQRVFDPIGLLSPAMLIPKLLLQKMWSKKIKWDDALPSDIEKSYLKWENQLSILSEIEIPRYVNMTQNFELHVFMDASKVAISACVFIRCVSLKGVTVNLLRAKSRVAPLKVTSTHRLELLACCLGARLVHNVALAIDISDIDIIAWSDSMVSLWWIMNKGEWSLFVNNRVEEIHKLIPNCVWRHIPGTKNPADLLSRGCDPVALKLSSWWKGPPWLSESSEQWPASELVCEMQDVNCERKKVKICSLNFQDRDIPWYAVKFSRYQSIIRLAAWILRFIQNSKISSSLRKYGELSLEEIERGEKALIKMEQKQWLISSYPSSNLVVFMDEEKVMRVKTRIIERIDEYDFLAPILMPEKSMLTRRLIEQYHLTNHQAGTNLLIGVIREKYWIPRFKKIVRETLRGCVICKRYKVKSLITEAATLPADRVNDARVFQIVGIDYAGPLYLKGGEKTWIVLFTCAVYRAIHIELATSLSAETFMLAFRRFISQRGRPTVVYSDNGTNFRSAQKELSNIDWTKVEKESQLQRIKWKFIPPTAAWWGGWWERIVRMIKELLRRSLGKAILTYEELGTVVCDCESIINSRPLTYISESNDDSLAISPSMFLLENLSQNTKDFDICDAKSLKKRIRYRFKLIRDLRKRFRTEYQGVLMQMRNDKKISAPLKLDEIVLVGDDAKKKKRLAHGSSNQIVARQG